jgi:hypothetical protein
MGTVIKIPGKKTSYEIPIATSLRGFASFGFDFFRLLFHSPHFFFSLNHFLSVYRSLENGSGGLPCFYIACHLMWIDNLGPAEADDSESFPT